MVGTQPNTCYISIAVVFFQYVLKNYVNNYYKLIASIRAQFNNSWQDSCQVWYAFFNTKPGIHVMSDTYFLTLNLEIIDSLIYTDLTASRFLSS